MSAHEEHGRAGRTAAIAGDPISDSPFSAGDRRGPATAWRQGWLEAEFARRAADGSLSSGSGADGTAAVALVRRELRPDPVAVLLAPPPQPAPVLWRAVRSDVQAIVRTLDQINEVLYRETLGRLVA